MSLKSAWLDYSNSRQPPNFRIRSTNLLKRGLRIKITNNQLPLAYCDTFRELLPRLLGLFSTKAFSMVM